MFDAVAMGLGGRTFIGILELLVVVLLISWRFSASVALLGVAVMMGVIIAHSTVLRIASALPVTILLVLCFIILVIRKKEIPIIGD